MDVRMEILPFLWPMSICNTTTIWGLHEYYFPFTLPLADGVLNNDFTDYCFWFMAMLNSSNVMSCIDCVHGGFERPLVLALKNISA